MLLGVKKMAYKVINQFKGASKPKISVGKNSIIVEKTYWNADVSEFQNAKYNVIKVDGFRSIKESDYGNIVAYIGSVPKDKLKRLNNLQWLQITSHGYNGYDDLSLYANENITVTNLHGVYSEAMAQYCVAMWHGFNCYSFRKALAKNVNLKSAYVADEKINVIIYGLGDIGSEIAKKCKNQSWHVTGVKRSISNNASPYVDEVISFEDSKNMLSKYDYVINVLPQTEETKGIYNKSFFERMKETALFCNVGRGSSVVDSDLDDAIKNGQIRGAILDACSSYKYNHPSIITTGHSSSVAYGSREKMCKLFKQQIESFMENDVDELLYKVPLK